VSVTALPAQHDHLQESAAPLGTAPDKFEPPFVEPLKIIREWRGEASNDQFGWIARNIGDVDGDGVNDIVTSAPSHGEKESNAGRIYVYSVGYNRLLWTADGRPGDQLGYRCRSRGRYQRRRHPRTSLRVGLPARVSHSFTRGGMAGYCSLSALNIPAKSLEVTFPVSATSITTAVRT